MPITQIQAVIIEDEPKSLAMLQNMLREYAPEVHVLGTAQNVREGTRLLGEVSPDLVFLDIAMPDGDGFEILEQIKSPDFQVIFTTAYEEYAIRAFDFSAMNYLLKPISSEDLIKVIDQFRSQRSVNEQQLQMAILQTSLKERFERIALPTMEGLEFLPVQSIVRCEADGSYTNFFMKDGRQIVVSKGLNHYEKLLTPAMFYRVHHKHLINLQCIKRYVKGSGGYVVLNNGETVDISVRRKEGFLQAIKELM